ncbi:tautomerase family protein [Schlegelella sp. S2-27]|uniref:Tautomerase family protein n=1 Tax=Caldimonas mangrovi TaxID=2944811 RepID=A0ABT0YK11_9BURK|nr:tautomerase family protein [Caldimonas mangrovi]MCM5679072.1 tautomerase family protein [Caldimonas mangrovi]
MPFAHLRYSADPALQTTPHDLATRLTTLTTDILGKKPEVTAVQLEPVDPALWIIGTRSLNEHRLASFNLRISITEGTNTKDEKERYVAVVYEAMQGLLGALHPASYVLVDEVRGDAYGYAGLTQERRYIEARLKAATR